MSLEKLNQSVAHKLALVEDSLLEVVKYREQLKENAQKIKEDIHEVVDRQVGSLRMRERHLVRQVEVFTAYETCRLSTKYAHLKHCKGALTATSKLLEKCGASDTNTLAKIKMDDLYYCQDLQPPANHVSVQLDEDALALAITKFGSVGLPHIMTYRPSPVIPVKAEEYEDEEHDVLHKSVAGDTVEASSSASPMHITVQFPRPTNYSWLFKQNNTTTSNATTPLAMPLVTPKTESSDVAAWLGDLKLDTAAPDDDSSLYHCSDDFDMMGMPTASEGSSIEIVPHFLDQDSSSVSSGLCEIENAHNQIYDKSRWLSTKTPEEANKKEDKLDITSACMANETCKSFSDCLCQNKCRENALEKLQQTANFRSKTSRKRTFTEAEGIQSVLTHMAAILSSENSQWLLKKPESDSPRPPKCVMYESPGDGWLGQSSGSSTKSFPRVHLSSHSNTWLLKNLKNQKNAQEKDVHEREKCTDEKENKITSEALSEALKRVCVDADKCKCIDESNCYSCLPSLTFKEQPWLLTRKCDSNKQAFKDQCQEKDKDLKPLWLFSPQKSRPGKEEASIQSIPSQFLNPSSPLHLETNSWLLH